MTASAHSPVPPPSTVMPPTPRSLPQGATPHIWKATALQGEMGRFACLLSMVFFAMAGVVVRLVVLFRALLSSTMQMEAMRDGTQGASGSRRGRSQLGNAQLRVWLVILLSIYRMASVECQSPPPPPTWLPFDPNPNSNEEVCTSSGGESNCGFPNLQNGRAAPVGGIEESSCLSWCAASSFRFCSFDYTAHCGIGNCGWGNRCCLRTHTCTTTSIAADARGYRIYEDPSRRPRPPPPCWNTTAATAGVDPWPRACWPPTKPAGAKRW